MAEQTLSEDKIKELVSTKLLKNIPDYAIQTVLRRVLFSADNNIDWTDFYKQIKEQCPEFCRDSGKDTDENKDDVENEEEESEHLR